MTSNTLELKCPECGSSELQLWGLEVYNHLRLESHVHCTSCEKQSLLILDFENQATLYPANLVNQPAPTLPELLAQAQRLAEQAAPALPPAPMPVVLTQYHDLLEQGLADGKAPTVSDVLAACEPPLGLGGDTTAPQRLLPGGALTPSPLTEKALALPVVWNPEWGAIEQWRFWVLGSRYQVPCEHCRGTIPKGEQVAWLSPDRRAAGQPGLSMHWSCLQHLRRRLDEQWEGV